MNSSTASTFVNNSGSAWQPPRCRSGRSKIATEHLRPLNQGLESLGSATNFEHYIETIYKPVVKPLMATTSFDRTRGVLDNYLIPAFGKWWPARPHCTHPANVLL